MTTSKFLDFDSACHENVVCTSICQIRTRNNFYKFESTWKSTDSFLEPHFGILKFGVKFQDFQTSRSERGTAIEDMDPNRSANYISMPSTFQRTHSYEVWKLLGELSLVNADIWNVAGRKF